MKLSLAATCSSTATLQQHRLKATINSHLGMSRLVGYGSSDEEGGNGEADAAEVKVPLSSLNYHASI